MSVGQRQRVACGVCEYGEVKLWATYHAAWSDADVAGDREGFRAFATAARQAEPLALTLDAPPNDWEGRGEPREVIRIKPRTQGDTRISFSHNTNTLVIGGAPAELMTIVGGPRTRLL
jgi:hypothetical protein